MSIPDENYRLFCLHESFGSEGSFGLKILAAGFAESEDARNVLGNASYELLESLHRIRVQGDPKKQDARKETIRELLACFPAPIWHEEVENKYCIHSCCWHLPWLRVVTAKGPVTIGWRKRVIEISWDDRVADTSLNLFPGEDVTKMGYTIHAWGLEKATEYLRKILGPTP